MQLMPKKKYLTELIFEILFVGVLSFCLLLPAVKKIAAKHTHNNLVSVSRLDFKIPSPSLEQIENIKKLNSVDKIFPFYDSFVSVQIKDGIILKDNYILIVPIQYKDEFPFSNSDLILKGKNVSKEDVAFVDFSFAKKNIVDVDSEILISLGNVNLEYTISGVINNFSDLLSSSETQENVILLFIDESKLSTNIGKPLSYSGAYVRCNDVESFKQYLTTYKPYGRMKQRDLFNSDQEYDDYVKYFNDGHYETEILNLELRNKLDTSNDGIKFSLIFAILIFVVILILNFLVVSDKSLIHNSASLIQNGEEYISVKKKTVKLLKILLYLAIVMVLGMLILFVLTLKTYCSTITLIHVVLIIVFLPLGLGLVSVFTLGTIVEKRNKTVFEEMVKNKEKNLVNMNQNQDKVKQ